ncbi:MAG: cytochrome C oxidase subunit I [Chitinophagaceae bacterium]|nr:cytochrome C oxidase subunit I [Chitinophagaceae bacterium]MCW5906005.1 cytochrome C oxidase subunit I [Chitinophagaceae bacterium]
MFSPLMGGLQKTTDYRVVLPFYIYASISFVAGVVLLLLHTDIVNTNYFNPYTLAITHAMALGWGTMIIFGASHQLLPVLVEGKLHSNILAYLTFAFAAVGIPILVYGFYVFNIGWALQTGATLINIAVIFYLINVFVSSFNSKNRNVHTWFIIAATLWLFSTTFFGWLLVFNFSENILPKNSVSYLSIHAHLGLVGWFLLMVIGVGSRLIPMFLISKYTNNKTLWWIFGLINISLISFIIFKTLELSATYFYISIIVAFIGIILFADHCLKAKKVRIRKNVDEQMKTSLLSVLQMMLPLIVLIITLIFLPTKQHDNIILLYGFCILFGWITAIILGMTFKTLPFIVWNKVYHKKAYTGKTPAPKELFSEKIYNTMLITYIVGFVLFIFGIIILNQIILKIAATILLMAALLYVINTSKVLLHKPTKQ